ncbi:MAG: heavy metal translocating P-type ATPase [Eubacteriales bacterium]
MKKERFSIEGMTCAACQANITRCVSRLEGVEDVNVSLLSNSMTVSYDDGRTDTEKIEKAVAAIGYRARSEAGTGVADGAVQSRRGFSQRSAAESKRLFARMLASLLLLIPLMYVSMGHMAGLPLPHIFHSTQYAAVSAFTQFLLTLPIIMINGSFFKKGFGALFKRAPNMDSLVAIGSSAALLYGIFALYGIMYGTGSGNVELVERYSHQLYFESAAMILALVTLGKFFEARSKSKTSDALAKLAELAPKTANVIRGGIEVSVPAESLAVGDIVVIRPGDIIPADGELTEGFGFVDQSAVTGESVPVEKRAGDAVVCATVNKNGSFRFRASKVGEDTTLSQIIRLVDEAGNSKAPIARLADKVSGVFVPVVMGIALICGAVWLIAGQSFEFALSRAISVLVISCPCALGLATPVAVMVGTGKAAESGILIKSAASLERLHSVRTVVLDKTGTVTTGSPEVTDVIVFEKEIDTDGFIAAAAALESGSGHPLALAVTEYARRRGLALPKVTEFTSQSGLGVRAKVDGADWIAGNRRFAESNGTVISDAVSECLDKLAGEGKTPMLFIRNGRLSGIIAAADAVRSESRSAVARLHGMGIRVIILTGDNAVTAEAVRKAVGADTVISDVMPAGKEEVIRTMRERGEVVAMVGDGINDAPALAGADVGIAIGAGTDIAIDSADIVLMKSSLEDVVTAIKLSRSTVKNIKMNLFWAFFYNTLGIPVAAGVLYPAFGITLNPMIGAAAMSLSSVCVVANALRLRFFKDKGRVRAAQVSDTVSTGGAIYNGDNNENKGDEIIMKKELIVTGMSCQHCVAHVKAALEALDGVKSAKVDLESGIAEVTVKSGVSDAELTGAVDAAGYKAEMKN